METDGLAPRALERRDAAGLIGVLAILVGTSMIGDLDQHLAMRIARRLADEGLLDGPADERALQHALGDLVERLRYALGEYADPPPPVRIPDPD